MSLHVQKNCRAQVRLSIVQALGWIFFIYLLRGHEKKAPDSVLNPTFGYDVLPWWGLADLMESAEQGSSAKGLLSKV